MFKNGIDERCITIELHRTFTFQLQLFYSIIKNKQLMNMNLYVHPEQKLQGVTDFLLLKPSWELEHSFGTNLFPAVPVL